MDKSDPRQIIASSPMTRLQFIIVGLTICLNALDGYDVMSISFASNGIVSEWGISDSALGFVLTAELLGMAIGSVFIGGAADKFGRRPTMLACVAVMAVGMFMVTATSSLVTLSIWRVITGLGIGGLLASINAVAAEFSNEKRRHLSVSIMAIGYPLGVVIGGSIATWLLTMFDWRAVFFLGGGVTLAFVPLIWFFIPESVHWLTRKQPEGALERINSTLTRMGHAAATALPTVTSEDRKLSTSDLFSKTLIATTLIVTAAYFFHITTFYFLMKWIPRIVGEMGFTDAAAGNVLVWAMAGGAMGGAVYGALTLRFGLKPLTIAVMVLSTIMVILFGRSPEDFLTLSLICAMAGFCTNAGIVGMYTIFAHAFPTHARASGTGFAIGIGRGGSLLAPVIAGFLFDANIGLESVTLVMGLGPLIAAGLLLFLRIKPNQPTAVSEGKAPEQPPLEATLAKG